MVGLNYSFKSGSEKGVVSARYPFVLLLPALLKTFKNLSIALSISDLLAYNSMH
jgi:hypothetical protein